MMQESIYYKTNDAGKMSETHSQYVSSQLQTLSWPPDLNSLTNLVCCIKLHYLL